MSGLDFFATLNAAVAQNESLLCVGLDPAPTNIPARFRAPNEPIARSLLRWNQAIIEATADLACCYKPNIAFYEAHGAEGHELLRATLAHIPANVPVILDVKRGDIGNTAQAYAQACFDMWQVDAVTISPYLGRDSVQPFIDYTNKGVFVLCHTSNPGGADFQHLEIHDWHTLDREGNAPLYIHVARAAIHWGPNIALVVGATNPDAMHSVRQAAPDAWFLVPGIGAQGGELEATVHAGLRSDDMGLIINVGRGISQTDDPGAAARQFREAIDRARTDTRRKQAPTPHATAATDARDNIQTVPASVSEPETANSHADFLKDLTLSLVELGAIKFGTFTLASGIESPIYIDLRLLVSDPPLLAKVAQAYAQRMQGLTFERVAGVPYAALPIGTAVALYTGCPMIYPRKEAKAYGLGKNIEGNWHAGERILIIEDLITSGGSIIQSAETLRSAGLVVEDSLVLIDRAQGGVEKLAQAGIRAHAVFEIHDILNLLEEQGTISPDVAQSVRRFFAESSTK
ncbi:MAG: orotidine-5'-phosphate decarboxylase [Litorilinea sp.]